MVTPGLARVGEVTYELGREHRADMRVPVRVFADAALLGAIESDRSLQQLVNVAALPGITRFALGMPDMHEGYGFPVGGVAVTEPPDGAISPGGIGFDINCGVRLLASGVSPEALGPVEAVLAELSRSVPTGYGRHGRLELDRAQMDRVLNEGCPFAIEKQGLGELEDLRFIESQGCLPGADASQVSERAKQRGRDQLGTLGGGNHFLELQTVEEVFEPAQARALGLFPGQVTVLIHSGSRGLGHQVCTDHVQAMDRALGRYGFELPDRQLACAPLSSREGQSYFGAMYAAANFAWCNRQVLTQRVREVFRRVLTPRGHAAELSIVYDVAHNIAKLEQFGAAQLLVHRKGATRAFGPSSPEIPSEYRGTGQPIFIPGSMGTASFVLVGRDESQEISLSSTCHGAGRALSRGAAKRQVEGAKLRRELELRGIAVRCSSNAELAEEAPVAYKDVERVVDVVVRAGIARKVARLRPIGVLKG